MCFQTNARIVTPIFSLQLTNYERKRLYIQQLCRYYKSGNRCSDRSQWKGRTSGTASKYPFRAILVYNFCSGTSNILVLVADDLKGKCPKSLRQRPSSITLSLTQEFDISNTVFSGSIFDRDILVYSVGLDMLFWALRHADSQSKNVSKSQLEKQF